PDPVFLSTFRADRDAFTARHPKITADGDGARILARTLLHPHSTPHLPPRHRKTPLPSVGY
ncbi:hypothetical protein PV421_46355, partial [Streptomyces scabiei]|nr:hypothetical protein [Streptomyces scabiei]